MNDTYPSLWKNADFLKLWSAQSVSVIGSMLGALQLTAVVALDSTPAQISILTASGVASGIIVGLPAGVWIDRLRRRPVLIVTDFGRMALLGSIPIAYILDALTMEQLYIVGFGHGGLTTVFDVAYRSYLPTVVHRGQLVDANSRLTATESIAEVGAFSLGGWIAQLFSAVVVAAVDSVTFLVSGLLLLWIRRPEVLQSEDGQPPNMRREIVEGLRTASETPILRSLLGAKVAFGISGGFYGTLMLVFGVQTLGIQPGIVGTIFGLGGLSSIVGSLIAGRVTDRFRIGPTLTYSFLLFAVVMLIVPVAREPLIFAGAILVIGQLFDFSLTIFLINEVSLRQTVTPDAALGRVNASFQFTEQVAMLIGALLAGLIAETFGVRWGLVAGASVVNLGAVWLFFSPIRRIHDLNER